MHHFVEAEKLAIALGYDASMQTVRELAECIGNERLRHALIRGAATLTIQNPDVLSQMVSALLTQLPGVGAWAFLGNGLVLVTEDSSTINWEALVDMESVLNSAFPEVVVGVRFAQKRKAVDILPAGVEIHYL